MLLRFGAKAKLQSLFAEAVLVLEDHHGRAAQFRSLGGRTFLHQRISRGRH